MKIWIIYFFLSKQQFFMSPEKSVDRFEEFRKIMNSVTFARFWAFFGVSFFARHAMRGLSIIDQTMTEGGRKTTVYIIITSAHRWLSRNNLNLNFSSKMKFFGLLIVLKSIQSQYMIDEQGGKFASSVFNSMISCNKWIEKVKFQKCYPREWKFFLQNKFKISWLIAQFYFIDLSFMSWRQFTYTCSYRAHQKLF